MKVPATDRPERMDIERRLEKLERRNRLLAGALAAVGALSVLAGAATRPDDVLRAKKIEMVDDAGKVRAELAIDADGSAGLFLRDTNGRVRGCAVHDDAQTGFFALDEAGQIRVGAAQFAHGGGGFALHGPEGKGATVLYRKGSGSLTFYGADGTAKKTIEE